MEHEFLGQIRKATPEVIERCRRIITTVFYGKKEEAMKVNTMSEAWDMADKLFPYAYEIDSEASENSYPIFRPVEEGHDGAYIVDYGDRLAVNLEGGQSTTIWVTDERSASPAYLAHKAVRILIFDHYDDYELALNAIRAAAVSAYIEGKVIKSDERVPEAYHSDEYFMIYVEECYGEPGGYNIKDMRRAAQ